MKPKIIFPAQANGKTVCRGGCDGGGCDGDCACALSPSQLSVEDQTYQIPSGWNNINLVQSIQATTLPLLDDTWVITAPGTLVGWAMLNEPARQVFDFFSSAHNLTEYPRDLAISTEDFQTATYTLYQAGFLTKPNTFPHRLDLVSVKAPLESWLFLTRACNMDCAHCFVSKDTRQMTLETGLQAIDRLFYLAVQHGHPSVKIKYAGGEPTLRWDLMTALHNRASDLSQRSKLPLIEILVTNGTALSRSRLEYLKRTKIQLSVSLDGFGEGHDRQRPFVNGQPSFEHIYKSIQMALDMEMRPYLTMTLTRLNLDELPDLAKFALQNRLFLNLNFYRPHIINDPLVAEYSDLVIALQKTMGIICQNLPDYPFLDKLVDRSNFGITHEHTCGAGLNYLSIDVDGNVLPCHMISGANQLGVPLNALSQVRFDSFLNPNVDKKTDCNSCEWRYWCSGGCPVLSKNITGTENSPSPYCEVYKVIYPELFRLKAVQLLKKYSSN